jgi:hypothetical protein
MKKNGDVMRSDRLKQVMQEIDASFDEKDLGMSKFSRFVQEAANRGLLSIAKLENGQLEIDLPAGGAIPASIPEPRVSRPDGTVPVEAGGEEPSRPRRGRRGRGGRGRDREDRPARPDQQSTDAPRQTDTTPALGVPDMSVASHHAPSSTPSADSIGQSGERLTRQEAFELVRKTVATLARGDSPVRASDVRSRARELLGRDSESLNDRMFVRVLKDAHDNGVIDLRRRGDDFEVAPAAEADSVADQLAKAAVDAAPRVTMPTTPQPRVGMGHRGATRGRGKLGAPPADLLSIGVVHQPAAEVAIPEPDFESPAVAEKPARGRKTARKKTPTASKPDSGEDGSEKPARSRAKTARKKAPSRTP